MLSKIRRQAAVLIALSLGAIPLVAQADWIVRLGGAWAEPNGTAWTLSPQPTPLETTEAKLSLDSNGPQFSGDVTWLSQMGLGVEFWINYPFSSDLTLESTSGVSEVGKVEYMSPMLNLQWHFNQNGPIRPYIGAGVVYNTFSGVQPSALSLDDDWSWTAGAGVDFGRPDRGWLLNVFVKYIDMSTGGSVTYSDPGPTPAPPIFPPGTGTQNTVSGHFDVSPWVWGISFGYRFAPPEAAPAHVAEPAPAPAAAPVVAAAPRAPSDLDGDGVTDGQDACPSTPTGDRVGPNGCSCDVTVQLNFSFNSAELSSEDKATLDRVATRLQELKFVGGEAGGYTDNTGDEAYNLDLSKRRAQAAMDYLATKGVASSRVTVAGYGEANPVADNATPEGRALNRRVVLRRTDCGPPPAR